MGVNLEVAMRTPVRNMPYLLLGLTLLMTIGASLVHFRHSIFYLRDRPSPFGTAAAGVTFFDRLRAQSGSYNVVNNYIQEPTCEVIDMDGKLVYKFPNGFCYFFKDGSLLVSLDKTSYFDPSGKLKWQEELEMHHDLDVSLDEQEIFMILWEYDTKRDFETVNGHKGFGGTIDSPGAVVVGNQLFINSGYAKFGEKAGNVLLCFQLNLK